MKKNAFFLYSINNRINNVIKENELKKNELNHNEIKEIENSTIEVEKITENRLYLSLSASVEKYRALGGIVEALKNSTI